MLSLSLSARGCQHWHGCCSIVGSPRQSSLACHLRDNFHGRPRPPAQQLNESATLSNVADSKSTQDEGISLSEPHVVTLRWSALIADNMTDCKAVTIQDSSVGAGYTLEQP